jgi:hypothetical protein
MGGILLREADEAAIRERLDAFRAAWRDRLPLDVPLHSYDIRQGKGAYEWLRQDHEVRASFMNAVARLVSSSPILCTACVIDRAGYAKRYFDKYDANNRWLLCKTALSVLLERTVKYVGLQDGVVRVYAERTNEQIDRALEGYYKELRTNGMPFDGSAMTAYQPPDPAVFKATLYDFKVKDKSSPLMQLADLCLYPVCNGGYNKSGRDYKMLLDERKLIDTVLAPEHVRTMGIKYSCFEGVTVEGG